MVCFHCNTTKMLNQGCYWQYQGDFGFTILQIDGRTKTNWKGLNQQFATTFETFRTFLTGKTSSCAPCSSLVQADKAAIPALKMSGQQIIFFSFFFYFFWWLEVNVNALTSWWRVLLREIFSLSRWICTNNCFLICFTQWCNHCGLLQYFLWAYYCVPGCDSADIFFADSKKA